MKKKILIAISYVLILALGITGTVAYFTDRDAEVNVFTVGDVAIELNDNIFVQGAELMPGKEIPVRPTITNTGKNDAWVWLTFSIPAELDEWSPASDEGSANNVIHWNPLGATAQGYVTADRVNSAIAKGLLPEGITAEKILADNMTWDVFNTYVDNGNCYRETINGVAYNTYVLPYNKAIEPGETTLVSVFEFDMDVRVDATPEGDLFFVEGGVVTDLNWNINADQDGAPKIYMAAYGIQAENFETVEDAYAAYGKQWGKNGGEHATVASVSTVDDLIAAINDGNDVVTLSADVATTEELAIKDTEVIIDLNGYSFSNTNGRAIKVDGSAKVTLINGTVNASTNAMGLFENAQIVAKDVVFNAKYCFGMNGTTTNETTGADFTDCEFHITSGYNAAYISAKGTYNFTNCVLEGGAGVLVRSGNVTLDGCTIIANGYMGKGNSQPAVYVNDVVTATDTVKDGVAYWNTTGSEKSTGDCIAIVDNSGEGYDLKSVTIKNCKFDVVNTVTVDGNEVATGYAVRYLNKDATAGSATIVFENNTDMAGNAIAIGTIGLVYSSYTVQ